MPNLSIFEEYEFVKTASFGEVLDVLAQFHIEVQRFFYETLSENLKKDSYCEWFYKELGEITTEPFFLEFLKEESVVLLRSMIERLSTHNASIELFANIQNYYQEIIRSFHLSSGLFEAQETAISLLEENMLDAVKPSLLVSKKDKKSIQNMSVSEAKLYFRQKNKILLSDILIDSLFQDNYYNVMLNIKEMLEYDKGKNLLPLKKRNFYETIQKIDSFSAKEKLCFYDILKNYDIAGMFYDDIRALRNHSLLTLKKRISKLHQKNYCKILSKIYGVPIYDFREEEYVFLARDLSVPFESERLKAPRSCYYFMSNHKNNGFLENSEYQYGYVDFDISKVLHVSERDSCSDIFSTEENRTFTTFVNRIIEVEDLLYNTLGNSEIQLLNDIGKNGHFVSLRPNVIFSKCYRIPMKILNEAKKWNIPIVLIKARNLSEKKILNTKIESHYVSSSYDESRAIKKRL